MPDYTRPTMVSGMGLVAQPLQSSRYWALYRSSSRRSHYSSLYPQMQRQHV
jgi:hypothetical protein